MDATEEFDPWMLRAARLLIDEGEFAGLPQHVLRRAEYTPLLQQRLEGTVAGMRAFSRDAAVQLRDLEHWLLDRPELDQFDPPMVGRGNGVRMARARLLGMVEPLPLDIPAERPDRCDTSEKAFGLIAHDASLCLRYLRTATPRPDATAQALLHPMEIALEQAVAFPTGHAMSPIGVATAGATVRSTWEPGEGVALSQPPGRTARWRKDRIMGWVPRTTAAAFSVFVTQTSPTADTPRTSIECVRSLSQHLHDLRRQHVLDRRLFGTEADVEVTLRFTSVQMAVLEHNVLRLGCFIQPWEAFELFEAAWVRGARNRRAESSPITLVLRASVALWLLRALHGCRRRNTFRRLVVAAEGTCREALASVNVREDGHEDEASEGT